jgi:tryptophan 2,3-dioxygenase
MIFTTLADAMVAATAALRAGRAREAVSHVEYADLVFARAAMLFRLVATLRVEAFADFRVHTEGASAIQSEQYKRFEAACARPATVRLESAAFANVPRVRSAVEAGVDTLSDARRAAGPGTDPGTVDGAALALALRRLEAQHQRWKAAHHGLAVRMLGDAPGSGYTAGVPYLRACLSNRLFDDLGDPADPGGLAAS